MSKRLWHFIKATSAALGASVLISQNSLASPEPASELVFEQNWEAPNGQLDRGDLMEQITSVSELRGVSPTEWAYEALRSLVERYGCIIGYPDRTYRGNRALTRWEFAAGLNACMNTMERLIQENVAVLKEDIETLKRLAREFEAELAALGGRIDNLEGRVAFLEDHQFSTTTQLKGEVIFALVDTFGDAVGSDRDESQAIFSDRVRLNFDTSFTGEDRLRVRLQAGNVPNLNKDDGNVITGTDMARLGFDEDTGNDIEIDELYYRFPIGDRITAWIGTNELGLDDVFNSVNPLLESSGTGALSRFGRRNPLVYRGSDGAGLGLKYEFSDLFSVTALYLADDDLASDSQQGSGLFNGAFSTGGQLDFSPTDKLELAFTYLHTYQPSGEVNLSGSTGSEIAKDPFDGTAATAERFGLQASWKITDSINFAAWGGYATAEARGGTRDGDNADLWTWNANVSFLDLGKEGARLSLAGGMPPKASNVDGGSDDEDTSYILEAQYQYPVTDEILITPGVYAIFNPNHDRDNDAIWVGVIRTTFKF
jgi:hypothetical protein